MRLADGAHGKWSAVTTRPQPMNGHGTRTAAAGSATGYERHPLATFVVTRSVGVAPPGLVNVGLLGGELPVQQCARGEVSASTVMRSREASCSTAGGPWLSHAAGWHGHSGGCGAG
jgi:hypothetical protein